MGKLTTITALLVLGFAGSAQATTIDALDGSPVYQQWVNASYLPGPDGTVRVTREGCPDTGGTSSCAYLEEGLVYYWAHEPKRVFLHELAHLFDYREMTEADRAKFSQIMRLDANAPWKLGGEFVIGEKRPSECFADAYATLAQSRRPNRFMLSGCELRAAKNRVALRSLIRSASQA